jgi:hypothetical protein
MGYLEGSVRHECNVHVHIYLRLMFVLLLKLTFVAVRRVLVLGNSGRVTKRHNAFLISSDQKNTGNYRPVFPDGESIDTPGTYIIIRPSKQHIRNKQIEYYYTNICLMYI